MFLKHTWIVREIGPSLKENRENIVEYYDLGSDLMDLFDLCQKIYPIPKMIRQQMMSWSVSSFCVLSFWELDISFDPNQGNLSNPTPNPNIQ